MRSLFLAATLTVTACASSVADPLALDPGIRFDASLDAMRTSFDRLCSDHDIRHLDPAELPIARESHIQVDCRGFDHAGAPRLAEFVFADDRLAFVWILTEATEEADHLARMRARYGSPSHDTPMFVAFTAHHTALRRDIPEFLYYAESIAPMYQAWFDQMAAQ